ncbi:hypothetical protein [Chryseobacterium foetidum]|uniref:hypothetical protein n=1 Tax=Chryseobacterium foetidum TaxID=2951057 RepID=UPI0021CAB63C|nr:hypothetical protein [Chryseobacterium foetidum]
MGNKIITEKDFWMCSSGAVPAQLQGTRKSNKKSSGEVYITVADTATSSWIDFGCTKNMLLAAIITAVAVVVVVALIVGTGGVAAIGLIGMMAIGAAAGVAGGVIAAIDGALKCGQKNAAARTWDGSKDNMILTGTSAITGDRTMACSIGGVVKFAPEVKSWTHALALGGFNYITQLAGCALGGAGVGAGGFLAAGLAGGSLAIAAPTFSSVLSNVAGGFTGIWGGSRALFGLNSLANEHAYGNVQDAGDAGEALLNGGVPEIGMAQRIFTGQAQPSDYLLFLYLLNIKAKGSKPPAEDGTPQGDKDGNNSPREEKGNQPREEDGNQPKDEDSAPQNKGKGDEKQNRQNDVKGNAHEHSLVDKIDDVQKTMTEGEASRTTYSVAKVKLADGSTELWVAAAGKKGYVPPRIRKAAGTEKVVTNKVEEGNSQNRLNDAEQTILREAKAQGATVEEIGATRPMCPMCQKAFDGHLHTVKTPLK